MRVAQNMSILYWTRKNAGKGGKSPPYCRITIGGRRSEFSLGIEVEEASFNKATGFLKGKSSEVMTINKSLIDIRSRLRKLYNDPFRKKRGGNG